MRSILFASLLFAAACTGSGSVRYQAEYSTPELVEIEPGVQVIADYEEPVFYSDNYYWRYNAGTWYRSRDYRRDWVRVEAPAPRVARISRPEAYVRYRANMRADVRDRRDRDRRDDRYVQPQPSRQPPSQGPVVREHGDRSWQPQPQPRPQPTYQPPQSQPQPGWQPPADRADRRDVREERADDRRDLRDDRKDARQDMRDDRKDARQDMRDERRDARQDMKDERRDARQDMKDERRDEKQERKEERRDQKQERKDDRQRGR